MFLFSFLLFKQENIINSKYAFPADYGFLSNGTYEINFTFTNFSENDYFSIFLLTKDEYVKTTAMPTSEYTSCDVFHSLSNITFPIDNSSISINGVVSQKETYFFHFLLCNDTHPYSYSLSFKNPDTYLDSREIPCLIIYPLTMSITAILIIGWIGYHIYKKRVSDVMYWITTSGVLIYILHLLFEYIDLLVESKKDTGNAAEYFAQFIDIINDSYYVAIVILVSTGYGFIQIELKRADIVSMTVLPLSLFSLATLSKYASSALAGLIYISIFLIACILIYEVYMYVKLSEKKVMAHMLVVSRRGIDPNSTPLKEKLNIIHNILMYTGTAIAFILISMIISACIDIDRYVYELFDFIIHFLLLAVLLWMYRPKSVPFSTVDVQGDQETFDLDDLDNVSSNLKALRPSEKSKWEPGTPLPREPKFTKQHKASNNQNYSPLE